MAGLTVADVMSKDVISVNAVTPFHEIAQLLTEHEISALPVVDPQGKPVGVVSEADLLVKVTPRGDTRAPGIFSTAARRRRFQRRTATSAAHVMTAHVTTVAPDEPLPQAARLLAGKLRRLFVVDEQGALVGVLARRDVVRVFTRDDEELADVVRRDVLRFALWAAPEDVSVTVTHGVVTLDGELDRRSEREWAGQLTEQIPGVVTVHNRIGFRYDDVVARA